ncbi:DciA family protein [Streptomyces platensis]|uniref:DciA family protein n=1 Tax=Streptomyces platensis TaxID=58346 RepID=UPI002F915F13|nr:DciA family protein [Streptomyces platensis]
MTETTTPLTQVERGAEPSGVDLARVALHAARKAAKKRGGETTPSAHRKPAAARRGEGRDPQGFGAVLQRLMAERAWDLPVVGGSILDRWPDIAAAIAPQMPHHVTAAAFHAETGQLDLRPDSPAYATQLRLITPRIITAANEAAGTTTVRRVRVLPVGAAPTPPTVQAPVAAEPVEPRRPAPVPPSEGFRQALAAHQAAWSGQPVDPAVKEAVKQQSLALRSLSARAFPETEPHPLEASRAQRRRQAAATEAAALRRARAEKAGRQTEPQRLEKSA